MTAPLVILGATRLDTALAREAALTYFRTLPANIQQRISRFRREEDRCARTLGWWLLERVYHLHGHAGNPILKLAHTPEGRPYISDAAGFDFNLSHAGSYVICGGLSAGTIGVDLEPIRPVELSDFSAVFSPAVFEKILGANDLRHFFSYWTKLESVVKAAGLGLLAATQSIEFFETSARLNGRDWHILEIQIDADYVCHIATDRQLDCANVHTFIWTP